MYTTVSSHSNRQSHRGGIAQERSGSLRGVVGFSPRDETPTTANEYQDEQPLKGGAGITLGLLNSRRTNESERNGS